MDRKIQGISVAGGLAVISIWLLGYFQPELMKTAPAGLEAAMTAIFMGVVGYFTKSSYTDTSEKVD